MNEIGAEKEVLSMTVVTAISYLQEIERAARARGQMEEREPVFILRGRDILAPAAVFTWAHSAERNGIGLKKLAGAWEAAGRMLVWPGRRMPD